MAPAGKEPKLKRPIDDVTPEDGDSTATTPVKKAKPSRTNATRASKKDPAESAIVEQESTDVGGTLSTGNEVQTTPVANKIRDIAVSEGTAAVDGLKDASGAGLQASDDEDDPTTVVGAKSTTMRKLISDSDDDEDDASQGFQGTPTNAPAVAPIPDEVAGAWGFSQLTTFKAKKLADVNDGTTIALRRLPRGLQYGISGTQKDRLIVDGKILTIILVGRVSSTYFQDTKSIGTVHVVPLLDSDLAKANRVAGDYSIPAQAAVNYTTVASCPQLKQGIQRYELFEAVYDVTKYNEFKPKDQMQKYNVLDIKPGNLVALELNMKKFTNKAQIQQASFDLKTIFLLRKGKAEDAVIVKKAQVEGKQSDNISGTFYTEFSSPIKGKGKERT